MSETKKRPWEQQPGETDVQYAMFLAYRDLAPSKRSQRRAAAAYYGKDTLKYKQWGRIASKWRWKDRVRAFDLNKDRATDEIIDPFIDRQKAANEHLFAIISEEALKAWESGDQEKMAEVKAKVDTLFGPNKLSQILLESHKLTIGSKEKTGDNQGGDDLPPMSSKWASIMAQASMGVISDTKNKNGKGKINVERN